MRGAMPSRGGRRRLWYAALIVLVLATAVALLEGALRAWPWLLGQAFVNGVRSRYSARDGGIFYRDRSLGIHFMIPNHRAQMYYNGYVWTHESDALGFRNRTASIPADILLLGDSYIYGHGVEIGDTVGVALEEMTGLRVTNLARQGDCAFQEAYLLTEYIGVFRPRHVVYFFYENDIGDLYLFLDDAALRAFIQSPVEAIRYPPRLDPALALREREMAGIRSWLTRARDSSHVVKAGRWLLWRVGVRPAQAAPGETRDPGDPASLAWQYTRKAIVYMRWLAARHAAELVIAPITPHSARFREILRGIAAESGVAFLDTTSIASTDAALWLPGDGHFSAAGARRMAAIVAAHIMGRDNGAAPASAPRATGGDRGGGREDGETWRAQQQ